ncbi:formate dehydrogenase subunit gamma [Pacificibacter marinus]|uniref:NADP-reducing hydrogenase subunit HndA n=1 Tax=Pacificibacter marinus TaxID=658057 RepID=A0A1Y5S1U6_9RHOB|nr:formate dehydrogenase subunit gamma [Pacificibacter marinus]SEK92953.1 formate dehydrogenase gamma subunit [Pacificibacter marinus]SLN30687.1 NADP-reducing hydrogenase subunit HndA [Pacificibacter marinus]
MRPPHDQPTDAAILDIIAQTQSREGPLLPMLHDLQGTFGYVPQAAVPLLAQTLNISAAEVHGVLSFYHDFKGAPAGRHVIKICRAEACQAVGANDLAEATLAKLGLQWHGTTANGSVTIEPVYCLGLCACGPAAMVDGKVIGRVDTGRMAQILEEVDV